LLSRSANPTNVFIWQTVFTYMHTFLVLVLSPVVFYLLPAWATWLTPVARSYHVRKKVVCCLALLILIFTQGNFSFANSFRNDKWSTAKNSKTYSCILIFSQPLTICSGASIVIKGDAKAPVPNSYSWEVLQGSTWAIAPGVVNGADYTPSLLVNNTNADIVFSIRRKTVTGGVIAYDSFYDITVLSALPIAGNTITAPAVTNFCTSGTPTIINGSTPTGNNGSFTYQWQSSNDNAIFTNIAGATAISYTPPVISATTYYRRTVNAVSCVAASQSNTVTISIISPVTNNVITPPAINSFCATSDPLTITGNTPAGGTGSFVYQWQVSTDNATFTDIPGAVTKDYDPPAISATTYYRRSAISGSCAVPVYSNVATLSILPALANNAITAPTVTTFCVSGDPAAITGNVPTGGNNTYVYQWQRSTDNITFTDIAGATAKDYDPPVVNAPTYYRRTATSGQCTVPIISNTVAINLVAFPAVPVAVQSTIVVCAGSTATLSVSSPQPGFTYNWYDSPAKTTLLFTGVSYVTPSISVNTLFYVESANGICSSTTMAAIAVSISPVTNNVIISPVINSFCSTSDPLMITGNIPSGGTGTFVYQWQSSTDNVTFTDIPGAVSKDYDPPAISATTYYRRSAISGSCAVSVYSNVITLSVLPALANNTIAAPAITTFCVSGDPAIIMGNVPTGGSNTYAYQWQRSTDNVTFTDIAAATAKDYDPSVVNAPTYFRREATSGQCNIPIISNVVAINLVAFPTVPVAAQSTVTVCSGSPATLSVNTPQPGFTYNWYDTATKTTLLSTGVSYTTSPVTVNKIFYVESSNGICSSTTMAAIQVILAAQPVTPLLANNLINICNGATATFNVSNAQVGYTYNWYTNSTGGTSVATGTVFTTPALSASTAYYVEAQNALGCFSVTRTTANVSVAPLLQFTAAAAGDVCPGSSASLTAATTQSNMSFQWFASASGGSALFTGATFQTPAINANTSYYVEATNTATGCVSASRQPAQVLILQPLPAPVVSVNTTTINSVTFEWPAISGATGYQVSTNNGSTFTDPSSGSSGLLHTVSGVGLNQPVTIIVRAIGASSCQLSNNSAAVTALATSLTDDIFVPNAFTPNGDGKNDVIRVHSEGVKTLKFSVYDQWGELLFATNDMTTGWDGTYKGAREPFGVYIYYLTASMNNGHQVNKKGTITLLR
jgi:gliding motility-associated-like protein